MEIAAYAVKRLIEAVRWFFKSTVRLVFTLAAVVAIAAIVLVFNGRLIKGWINHEYAEEAEVTGLSSDESSYQIKDLVGESSDYSEAKNWLMISPPDKEVDTFYIYPTIVASDRVEPIVPITNAVMRAGAEATLVKNAMAFQESTNLFAPFYRQSNLNALAPLREEKLEEFQMQEQRTDIYGALDYYFEHYNEGRPFILAGHSQGSIMVKIVLEDYMQAHPDLYKRMVAAYVIGYSVTKDDLKKYPHLKFAEGEEDTGVIISWNTEGPKNRDADNIVVLKNAISINPINWKRDDTYAPASDNLGSRIDFVGDGKKFTEDRPGLADAQVDTERGVVVCTNDELPVTDMGEGYDIVGPQSYHKGDYAFYYQNIRDNANKRVKAYLKNRDDEQK